MNPEIETLADWLDKCSTLQHKATLTPGQCSLLAAALRLAEKCAEIQALYFHRSDGLTEITNFEDLSQRQVEWDKLFAAYREARGA